MKRLAFFLAALSLLTACSSSKVKELDEATITKLNELSEQIKVLDENIDKSTLELDKIEVANSAIEESIIALKDTDAVFGDEIGEISTDVKKLKDFYAVKVHFEKSGVVFKSQMDKFTIVMPYDVTFEFNKYELKSKFNELLDAVSEAINMAPELNVEIVGHTDNIGTPDYNRKLSEKRAQAVKDYLVSKGVDKNRLVVKGMGFDEPVTTNDTEEGRALNRRVEINIIN
jgi:outer membrane protein OmpA-like peptidoglycan-associated protein